MLPTIVTDDDFDAASVEQNPPAAAPPLQDNVDVVSLADTIQQITEAGSVHDVPANGKRSQPQYQLGSTIGASFGFPRYVGKDGGIHNMPRPYQGCMPGQKGHAFLNQEWFKEMMADLYFKYTMDYLDKMRVVNPSYANYLRELFTFIMEKIPPELRIGNTPFTQLSLVGGFFFGLLGIALHTDPKDLFSLLLHAGEVEGDGGSTLYYKGCNPYNSKLSGEVPFMHGQVHIGLYDTTLHGCRPWSGKRWTFNINIKKETVEFFRNNYYPLYKMWVDYGRPTKYNECPQDEDEVGFENIWYIKH